MASFSLLKGLTRIICLMRPITDKVDVSRIILKLIQLNPQYFSCYYQDYHHSLCQVQAIYEFIFLARMLQQPLRLQALKKHKQALIYPS